MDTSPVEFETGATGGAGAVERGLPRDNAGEKNAPVRLRALFEGVKKRQSTREDCAPLPLNTPRWSIARETLMVGEWSASHAAGAARK